MAGKLSEAVGSLADGAERLERIIRGVKDRQLSEAHNAPTLKPVTDAFVVSPEEAWSKKFMTAGIGPANFKPVQMPSIAIAAPIMGQTFKPVPKDIAPAIESAGAQRPGPIGQALAKPTRKRSWFGRLVRVRGR